MAEVISLQEYAEKKRLKEERTKSQGAQVWNRGYSYPGKLGEAMEKYGSHTGQKNKDRFKDKIELGE